MISSATRLSLMLACMLEIPLTLNLSLKELRRYLMLPLQLMKVGKFNVFCKIRAKGTTNAKNIIFKL